jgi:hypothetical protein
MVKGEHRRDGCSLRKCAIIQVDHNPDVITIEPSFQTRLKIGNWDLSVDRLCVCRIGQIELRGNLDVFCGVWVSESKSKSVVAFLATLAVIFSNDYKFVILSPKLETKRAIAAGKGRLACGELLPGGAKGIDRQSKLLFAPRHLRCNFFRPPIGVFKKDAICQFSDTRSRSHLRVNDELCDFPATIGRSKSSHQVMWLLLVDIHLQTNRTQEGTPGTSERRLGPSALPRGSREGVTQGDLSIEVGKSPFAYRHRSLFEVPEKVREISELV